MDIKIVLHLATGSDPVSFDGSTGAVGKTQKGAAYIVHIDRASVALDVSSFAYHRNAVAHDLGDRPEQELGSRQCVAAQIGQSPAARRIMAEGEGTVGVSHVVLGMQSTIAANFAQFPCRNHLPRQCEHRVAQVVESHLRTDSCFLRSVSHLARIIGKRRQRLFTVNVLPGSDRGKRHFLVQRVGCGDRDNVDFGVIRDVTPIGRRTHKAVGPCRTMCCYPVNVGNCVEFDVHRQIENPRCGNKPECMGLAHESGANQADLKLGLDVRH